MKAAGFIVLAVGCISGAASLYLDTTVGVENQVNGWTQVERVHNIGRMDQRRNLLIASGFIALVGTLFVGFGFLRDARRPRSWVSTDKKPREKAELFIVRSPYCSRSVCVG
jgi:hypothetical protein